MSVKKLSHDLWESQIIGWSIFLFPQLVRVNNTKKTSKLCIIGLLYFAQYCIDLSLYSLKGRRLMGIGIHIINRIDLFVYVSICIGICVCIMDSLYKAIVLYGGQALANKSFISWHLELKLPMAFSNSLKNGNKNNRMIDLTLHAVQLFTSVTFAGPRCQV